MKQLQLPRLRHAHGEVRLPGSKSLSNRALLLAALARGTTTIRNLLKSDDTDRMLAALARLGVAIERDEAAEACVVVGQGGAFRHTGDRPLELLLGNAGTAVRPLTAALTLGEGSYQLGGDPRMHERPIADLTDALQALGAQIEFYQQPGFLPLCIHATGLSGGQVTVRGDVSSQFLTALLMAAPLAKGALEINVAGDLVSAPYIRITLDTLARFGVVVEHDADLRRFLVQPRNYESPGEFLIEGDASSATYLLAAGVLGGGPVRVYGVGSGSVQGDVRFAEVLTAMGATVRMGTDWIEASRGGNNRLHGVDMDLNHITDAAMTVATLALFADGRTMIRNVGNWRVKETDRLHAMATELRKLGARVEEGSDYLGIDPPPALRHATIDTYDDHRIAMSFALAAFGTTVAINDPDCVAKTFPQFFDVLATLTATDLSAATNDLT